MRKKLFVIATAYMVFCIVWFLPAYGTSPKFYEHRYSATERERQIIKDVYDHMTTPLRISLWSFLGMYGLFAASIFCERKKNKQRITMRSDHDRGSVHGMVRDIKRSL